MERLEPSPEIEQDPLEILNDAGIEAESTEGIKFENGNLELSDDATATITPGFTGGVSGQGTIKVEGQDVKIDGKVEIVKGKITSFEGDIEDLEIDGVAISGEGVSYDGTSITTTGGSITIEDNMIIPSDTEVKVVVNDQGYSVEGDDFVIQDDGGNGLHVSGSLTVTKKGYTIHGGSEIGNEEFTFSSTEDTEISKLCNFNSNCVQAENGKLTVHSHEGTSKIDAENLKQVTVDQKQENAKTEIRTDTTNELFSSSFFLAGEPDEEDRERSFISGKKGYSLSPSKKESRSFAERFVTSFTGSEFAGSAAHNLAEGFSFTSRKTTREGDPVTTYNIKGNPLSMGKLLTLKGETHELAPVALVKFPFALGRTGWDKITSGIRNRRNSKVTYVRTN
jgi:hypothetical protein